MWMENGEHFKIGKTKNIKSRICQHRGSNPFIYKVDTIEGDFEGYLIRCCKMAFNSIGREWFVGEDIESTAMYLDHCMQTREDYSDECEAVDFIRKALQKVEFKNGSNETE